MNNMEFRRDADGKPLWHAPIPHPTDPHAFGPCQLCGEPWPCTEARYDAGPISITGVYLSDGPGDDGLTVRVEVDGEWRTVIAVTHRPGELLSHIVEPLGIRHAKVWKAKGASASKDGPR